MHTGRAVALRRSNVDTDQIIPAVYLKRVTRTGFEDGLFAAWRNDPDFVLNRPESQGATVLVAGPDFGTGSSREHAVWALRDHGFRVVVSSRFADIFRGNAGKGGLVTACVAQPDVERLWSALEAEPGHRGDRGPQCPHRFLGLGVGAVRHRRLHQVAADGGPGRRRPDPDARRRRWPLSRPAGRPGCRRRSDRRPSGRPGGSVVRRTSLRHNGKRGRRCLSLAVHAHSVAPESSDRSTSASARGNT